MSESLLISVLITLFTIFAGIVLFMVFTERKISRLEKDLKQLKSDLNTSAK
jgi:hypothetical protein